MKTSRNWQIFTTADGSPTLIWSRADGYVEKMHHSGGALTESLYIYQTALRDVLNRGWPARVLSLGLGLGYNELIAMAEIQRSGRDDWAVYSFESEEPLRASFADWLNDRPAELQSVHEDVLGRVAAAASVTPEHLRAFARTGLSKNYLELRGRFPETATGIEGCACVFYDAYSKKMDADLWDEERLIARLGPLLAPRAALSTYAATGSMKRALKALGFRLLPRTGFLGKRESTLAIRE